MQYCGSDAIRSEVDVQQGDLLDPLLFTLVLQPLLVSVSSLKKKKPPLMTAYLDDVTIVASSPREAFLCQQLLQRQGAPRGQG
ncbi:hypothetical protein EON63_24690 [archaeon]|nr:MAG: hypothetical protein EON63_24690 [archaeon]